MARRCTTSSIVGAGPVGMALALALVAGAAMPCAADRRARARRAPQRDPRGARPVLRLAPDPASASACWPQVRTPRRSRPSTSRSRARFGRTVIRAADHRLPALGYVADAGGTAPPPWTRRWRRAGIEPQCATRVENVAARSRGDAIVSICGAGRRHATLRARLVAHAEGAGARARPPGRARLRPAGDHRRRAERWSRFAPRPIERFTAGGPLALLPYQGGYARGVLRSPAERAQALLATGRRGLPRGPAAALRRAPALSRRSGPRTAFPLALRLRRDADRRAALRVARQCGADAASGGRPGLQSRRCATCGPWPSCCASNAARAIRASAALLAALRGAARRIDRGGTIGFTDGLIRRLRQRAIRCWRQRRRRAGWRLLDILPAGCEHSSPTRMIVRCPRLAMIRRRDAAQSIRARPSARCALISE
ncbi:MAG: hypothetical protein MZW92_11430 [Comamonadaceae bacterium]|nr:hypothetical protein [Comamonadaceae bacterium]